MDVHGFYRKLLTLYPGGFRERLGESMEQTFNDLHRERQAEARWTGFVLWIFVETALGILREHVLLVMEGVKMKNLFANPSSAVPISSILYLPASPDPRISNEVQSTEVKCRNGFICLSVAPGDVMFLHPDHSLAKGTRGKGPYGKFFSSSAQHHCPGGAGRGVVPMGYRSNAVFSRRHRLLSKG